MNYYRREYDKIYRKVNTIAQKGKDGVFDYYKFIDEIVSKSQYGMFEDVMITKYKIDIRNFLSVNDMKKETFELIRRQTTSKPQVLLKKILDSKNVYSNGFYFYDKSTNKYLGDIKEIEPVNLSENKLLEINTEVEAIVGLSSSIYNAIPNYIEKDNTKYYPNHQVIYDQKIYHCILSYTYSITNPITPTYSTYWNLVKSPTYSTLSITNSNTITDKYKVAIDYLKSFTYSII